MKVHPLVLGCVVLGSAIAECPGQTTLIGWNVNGVPEGATTLTATTFGTHISTSSPSGLLSRGPGASAPGSPSSNAFGASGFSATSLNNAIAAGDYFTFTLSADSGYSLSLSTVTLRLFNTTSGPTNAALFSSVGGFSSGSAAITSFSLTGNANNDQTITLSSGSFSNLTGTVEFRLYAYGGGTSTTDKLRFRDLTGNDLTVTGTLSAIPEPSTYAAIAGAVSLLGTVYWRRRQRSCDALRS